MYWFLCQKTILSVEFLKSLPSFGILYMGYISYKTLNVLGSSKGIANHATLPIFRREEVLPNIGPCTEVQIISIFSWNSELYT